ncbi:ribosome biogenesis GTPase Der [Pelagibius litoralis]|uniref:GTPase Der n=1 Tax=Pelagibius litoralis TaxID=374515 RepID=A0A967KBE2_9PROT|nr:ribosome biogenesis GTPase Der [Pelagibius litoralis]NIA70319.1 ribosome biogenesis GTPase Der [Pelagibius litoralis]
MTITVAILGRPNVGKSTLFNRLVGQKLALVDDTPGVTRDRREGEGNLFGFTFRVIDTAGLEERFDASLEGRMRVQTERALEEADITLLVIDVRAGLTPLDEHFANWLRRSNKPVALVANKCEGRAAEAGLAEAYALGLGEPIPISAEHGLGMSDLFHTIQAAIPEADEEGLEDEAAEAAGPLQLAIVGRPNVGKSTLVNKLLGEERLLTGPEAGITRDSIAIDWAFEGRPIRLVDTAGLRRKARVTGKIEKLSTADTLRTIRFAQVVVLLLDVEEGLEKQDLTIARMVVDEGRALIIGVNKWDSCRDRDAALLAIRERIERSLPQVRGVPLVTLSALQGHNIDRLMQAVFGAHEVWNRRIGTADLNRWLEAVTAAHPPPASAGRRVRLKYMTQAKSRPPTFAIFCTKPQDLPTSYLRYLENGLRETFDLPGTPIRINIRKGENPYAKKK